MITIVPLEKLQLSVVPGDIFDQSCHFESKNTVHILKNDQNSENNDHFLKLTLLWRKNLSHQFCQNQNELSYLAN